MCYFLIRSRDRALVTCVALVSLLLICPSDRGVCDTRVTLNVFCQFGFIEAFVACVTLVSNFCSTFDAIVCLGNLCVFCFIVGLIHSVRICCLRKFLHCYMVSLMKML